MLVLKPTNSFTWCSTDKAGKQNLARTELRVTSSVSDENEWHMNAGHRPLKSSTNRNIWYCANRVFRAGRRLVNISEFLPAQTNHKVTPSPPTCQTSRRLTLIVRKRFLATMLFFSGIVETIFGRRLNKPFDRLEKREGACALFVLSKKSYVKQLQPLL